MEDCKLMGYDEKTDILYEWFGVETDEELEEALECWCND